MGLLHRRRTWTPNPTDPTAPWWRLEFDVTGYDARGRALGHSWVIPAEVPGLAGTYTAELAYDTADHLIMTTYPAMGDLPSEALVTAYSPEGNPRQMLTTLPTLAWVVSDTTWDNVGRVTSRTTPAGVRSYGYDVVSGRLSNQSFTTQATGVVVQNDSYVWDAGGNLTTITSNPANTAFRERQCFGYDTWNRLSWARTTSTTTACSPSADHQHGPGPYEHSYNYNAINNLTSGPAGTYSYPTPGLGVSRPHAPTSINGVGHSWNAAGQLTSRTGQWSATYTPQGQSATITAGNQRTVYAYGPDAERVLTHTINTATNTLTSSTLTLGNLGELTIDHATGSLQATRFLTMAGTTVAVRANDGTLTWPLGNHQGSIVATVTTAGATQRHLYTPYGAARTTPPATTATRGFLNQPHNTTHQLSHLHHRHYDPHSGIFTTVDPLVTATGTPYLYANANPTTLSDPMGLVAECGTPSCGGLLPALIGPSTGSSYGEAAGSSVLRGGLNSQVAQNNEWRRQGPHAAALSHYGDLGVLAAAVAMWEFFFNFWYSADSLELLIESMGGRPIGNADFDHLHAVLSAELELGVIAAFGGLGVATVGAAAMRNIGTSTPRRTYPSATNTARLAQDVAVSPTAPRALGLNRSIGRPSHNQALQSDIAGLPRGATDIRVNQQQVNAAGQRVGVNRPDLQYTVNGQRFYVEYEGVANPRGAAHTSRILANDPTGIVDVRLVP